MVRLLGPATAALLLSGCTGKDSGSSSDKGPTVGDPALTTIVLEVDYQPGAEPYTGAVGLSGDTWDLFQGNADALFAGTGVTVLAPSALGEMGQLGAGSQEDYTVEDLLALSDGALDTVPDDETRVLHVLWLDGYFADADGRQDAVLGVSIGNTGVLAMFKPVIEGLGLSDAVRRFGEQATLIHEFGHAVGLVNNGLEMVTAHQDAEHGAHCSDDACVMYWANEGAADLAAFVVQYATSGDSVLFGADCRADVQAAFE